MKKLYYLLLMVCTVFAFTACSDDDDGNGDNPPKNPVTEYSVPAQGEIGGPVTIKGKGYTAESKIFLKNTKTEVEATVTAHTAVDLVFTVPVTLTAGTYTVVLNQAGGKWDLGSIALIAANPVKDFEIVEKSVKAGGAVNVKGTGWADNCRIYLLNAASVKTDVENIQKTASGIQFTIPASVVAGIYTVMLEQTGDWSLGTIEVVSEGPKKLSKVVFTDFDKAKTTFELFYNAEGKIDSVYRLIDDFSQGWKVTYTESSVTVVVKGEDSGGDPVDKTTVYSLVDGVAKSGRRTDVIENKTTDYTLDFSGDFFTKFSYDDVTLTYVYEEGLLTEGTNSTFWDDPKIIFEYEPGRENNFAGIDGLAFILYSYLSDDFEARLLGLTGAITDKLPSYFEGGETYYAVTCTPQSGVITEMKMVDPEDSYYTAIFEFTYK